MSRVRETLQQEAGKQLPQGEGVHAKNSVYGKRKMLSKSNGKKARMKGG